VCLTSIYPSECVGKQRESCPELGLALPIGFVRHSHALPFEVLECVPDIVEFQGNLRIRATAHSAHFANDQRLDFMQASIESRLTFQGRIYRQQGVVAEAVRLALFMCCYCSWMEIWNDSLIPCRLADRLFDLLESTQLFSTRQSDNVVWLPRMDVLLWLLWIGASVVELDQGYVDGLKSKQHRLYMYALTSLDECNSVNLKSLVHNALQDFIYTDGWRTHRCPSKDWFDLELAINARTN